MKLTKLQRHTAYIIMLAQTEIDTGSNGYCYMFKRKIFGDEEYFDNSIDLYDPKCFKETFPELWAKKPKDVDHIYHSWFPYGWKYRIELLNQCITETF